LGFIFNSLKLQIAPLMQQARALIAAIQDL